jgi:hypothetical protein
MKKFVITIVDRFETRGETEYLMAIRPDKALPYGMDLITSKEIASAILFSDQKKAETRASWIKMMWEADEIKVVAIEVAS